MVKERGIVMMIMAMKNQSDCELCGRDVLQSLTFMRIGNVFGRTVEIFSLTVCGYFKATIYSPYRTDYFGRMSLAFFRVPIRPEDE